MDLREQRKPIRPNTSSSEEYYRSVQSGYDLLAPSYDQDIGGNAVGIRMREIFRQSLRDVFPGGQRLFEIGCGSGIDSLWLAGLGFSIVATDISGKMIVEVDRKAKRDGLQSRIETQKQNCDDNEKNCDCRDDDGPGSAHSQLETSMSRFLRNFTKHRSESNLASDSARGILMEVSATQAL